MNQEILNAKKDVVAEITKNAKESETIIIAQYKNLTVANLQELRRVLAKDGATATVYKNSLFSRACKELGYEGADKYLEGPNVIIFSKDLSAGAKIMTKYSKRFGESLVIKGGIVEGTVVDDKKIVEVGKMPNKEGLLSMLLSCLQAPIRQFAATVKAVADAK